MPPLPNMNTHFKVVNSAGTTGQRCGCSGWLRHWQRYSSGVRAGCAKMGCRGTADVGAHVESVDLRRDRDMWIVPLCHSCNSHHKTASFFVDSRSWVVRAERMEKCGPG
jgi:hypothetical protein